jgi:hypothetical protein
MKPVSYLLALFALAGCALFNSPPANAGGTVIVTWANPLLNDDSTTIPLTQGAPEALQRWRIEYGSCGAGGAFSVKAGEFVRDRAVGGAALVSATQNLPAGLTCVRVFVANVAGIESDASNVASRNVPAAKPGPPTQVLVALQGS